MKLYHFESKNQIAPIRLTGYTEVEEEQRKNRKEEEATSESWINNSF